MKSSRPAYIILVGSSILAALSFVIFIVADNLMSEFNLWWALLISILVGAIAYLIFFSFVKRFISSKIKLIYRSIRKGKMAPNEKISLYTNVIEDAANETKNWAEEKSAEITQLKEKEAFRKEFLGNLAHELKTPVFSIQGYILTLLEGGLEDDSVNTVFLERAAKATDRIAAILDDLDEITKLEVDHFELHLQSFDIVDLFQEVIESLQFNSEEKNINIKFQKSDQSIFVMADRSKISQVVTNLLNNSISYNNEGGETVIRFHQMDDSILCEVSDNGPGIDEKLLPRLFERFYRVEQSRNRNEGGSGLGLAIVKHIIESHDQSIHARSTVGIGSTFSFTLAKGKNA